MSRPTTWAWMMAGAIGYWGVVHGFAINEIETTVAAIYFSGAALFFNWIPNRVKS